ncbi:hypothetical protein O181_035403 [Austropuccinia psidii MF-1]|uniref:Uncharacterized protein n=1 Tax=Austropuccinia psidii MF-1 TaxID=1389203 RepID=A0A9Q3D7D6_9BASI|nr:hypothetical protein [Austropuccinia psidii MF-1]
MSEEAERSQEPSRKGKRQRQLARTFPTTVKDAQIGTLSSGQCFEYVQNSYGTHSQRAVKNEQDFSMQIIEKIQFVKSSFDVELGRVNEKLNPITSDINELRRNDRISADWNKLTTTRLDLISNACDRIESIYQV